MSEEKNIKNTNASEDKIIETKEKKAKNNGGIKAFLKSRKAKHGAVATAIVAVVIALVIVLNVVVGLLVDRFPDLVVDFTSNNSFALQEDTVDYVSHLDSEVTVSILLPKDTFENQGAYFVQAQQLLEKMQGNSNGKLKLKYVDLTSNPTFTSAYPDVDWQTTSNNYIVLVECGKQYRALTLDDCFEYDTSTNGYNFTGTKIEQAVITAMLNVTTDNKVVVNMIKGNQEQDYSAIKKLLENNAYQVNEVSLATSGLDDDADVAMLYAPSVDLDESAIEKLDLWLDNDGKKGRALIYVPTGEKGDTPNLDEFLEKWGMKVSSGFVYETDMTRIASSQSPFIITVDYTDYYKDGLKNAEIPVVVSDSHDIEVTDESLAHSLLVTGDKAGVMPKDVDEKWSFEDGVTGKSISVAAEGVVSNEKEESSRVIVFGSYMMFSDSIMQYNSFNNSTYFMNVINTISGKDDVGITIESKSIENKELGITDVATQNVMFVIFVAVIPIVILCAGLVVWLRRRNK